MRPSLTLCLTLLVLAPPAPGAPKRTRASIQKAFDQNRGAVVEVIGPKASGTGVMVGALGQVVASVEHVSIDAASVWLEGQTHSAKVLAANAELGLAVLQLEGEGPFRSVAIEPNRLPEVGDELVAIELRKKSAIPQVVVVRRAASTQHPFVELSGSASPGTPLFDRAGRLIGVVAKKRRGLSLAVTIPDIQRVLTPQEAAR